MATLPFAQAVTRFQGNEDRIDVFVNDPESAGTYTTSGAEQVRTLPALAADVESQLLELANDTDPTKGAALVGFKGRSVAERLSDWVSVKDFGAVGDNATDDSAAIQLALDWANAQGGGEVVFPPGVYIAENLTIYGNTTLRGAGTYNGDSGSTTGCILKLKAASANHLLQSNAYRNNLTAADHGIRIDNIAFHGNRYNGATGDLIVLSTAGARVTRCRVDYGGGHGIVISAATANGTTSVTYCGVNLVGDCQVLANAKHGVYGRNSASNALADVIVTGCSIGKSGSAGSGYRNLYIERGAGTQVIGNNIFQGYYGNVLINAAAGTFVGNIIEDNDLSTLGVGATYIGTDIGVASVRGSFLASGNWFVNSVSANPSAVTYVHLKLRLGGTRPTANIIGNGFTSGIATTAWDAAYETSDDVVTIAHNSYGELATFSPQSRMFIAERAVARVHTSDTSTFSNNYTVKPMAENGLMIYQLAPSGNGTFATMRVHGTSDVDNSAFVLIEQAATYCGIRASALGSATQTPLRIGDSGEQLGFFGSNGTIKQNVSGSRGGNAALASLLTVLASMGLITNNTTA